MNGIEIMQGMLRSNSTGIIMNIGGYQMISIS